METATKDPTYEYGTLDDEVVDAIGPDRFPPIRYAARLLGVKFNDIYRARQDPQFAHAWEAKQYSNNIKGRVLLAWLAYYRLPLH